MVRRNKQWAPAVSGDPVASRVITPNRTYGSSNPSSVFTSVADRSGGGDGTDDMSGRPIARVTGRCGCPGGWAGP